MTPRRLIPLAIALLLAAACGKDAKDDSGGLVPAHPHTGAPVAFDVLKLRKDALDVQVYNFTDRTFATYSLLLRYYDQDGKTIMVKPGTAFEKDHDFWSVSGRGFISKPGRWTRFTLDHLEIPAGAVKAEILARSVTAVKADGMTMEEESHWQLEDGMSWPEAPAVK